MLAALSRWPRQHEIACDVSLENQMACGFGACFSCVAPIRQADGSTDLRRVMHRRTGRLRRSRRLARLVHDH